MLRQLSASGRVLVLLRVAGLGLGFAVTALLSRLLGAEGFGRYSLFLMIVTLLGVPLGRGWSTLVLRTVSRVADPHRWSTTALLMRRGRMLSAGYAAAVFVIGAGLMQTATLEISLTMLLATAALLVVRQNASLRLAVIRGAGYPVAAQLPEMILQPALGAAILLGIAVFVSAPDWSLAVGALLASSLAALLFGNWLQNVLVRPSLAAASAPGEARMAEWLGAAGVIGLNGFLTTLFSQIDSYVLAAYAGTGDVGVYRVAVQFSVLGAFAYTVLNYLAAARVNAAWSAGRREAVEQISERYGLYSLAFVGAAFIAVFAVGREVIGLVFGAEFVSAVAPILILLVGQAINAAVGIPAVLLTMTGHDRLVVRVTLLALPVNALAALLLVPLYGAHGAAVASALSLAFLNIYYYWVVRRRLGVNMAVWRRLF